MGCFVEGGTAFEFGHVAAADDPPPDGGSIAKEAGSGGGGEAGRRHQLNPRYFSAGVEPYGEAGKGGEGRFKVGGVFAPWLRVLLPE